MGIRQFEPARAVEVTSPQYGSAYRIGGRLVLTAAHLLQTIGSQCRIRSKLSFGEVEAKVVWRATNADVALIELPEGIEGLSPIVFGELPPSQTGEIIPFQMYGWPRWGRTERDEGRTAAGGRQVNGEIYLADYSPDGLLVLEALRCPDSPSKIGSDWEGNSGAAIVCNGLVIAVQRQHQNPNRSAALEAEPLVKVYGDQDWQEILEQHGVRLEVAIVRLENPIQETPQNQVKVSGGQGQQVIQPQGSVIQAGDYATFNVGSPSTQPPIAPPFFYPADLGSPTFVGRETELKDLHRLLERSDRVAIAAAAGMGGIGKTELAWQYAHHHRKDYPAGIWWISLGDRVGQVLTYGTRMQLPQAPDNLTDDGQRVQ